MEIQPLYDRIVVKRIYQSKEFRVRFTLFFYGQFPKLDVAGWKSRPPLHVLSALRKNCSRKVGSERCGEGRPIGAAS